MILPKSTPIPIIPVTSKILTTAMTMSFVLLIKLAGARRVENLPAPYGSGCPVGESPCISMKPGKTKPGGDRNVGPVHRQARRQVALGEYPDASSSRVPAPFGRLASGPSPWGMQFAGRFAGNVTDALFALQVFITEILQHLDPIDQRGSRQAHCDSPYSAQNLFDDGLIRSLRHSTSSRGSGSYESNRVQSHFHDIHGHREVNLASPVPYPLQEFAEVLISVFWHRPVSPSRKSGPSARIHQIHKLCELFLTGTGTTQQCPT